MTQYTWQKISNSLLASYDLVCIPDFVLTDNQLMVTFTIQGRALSMECMNADFFDVDCDLNKALDKVAIEACSSATAYLGVQLN